MALIIYLHFQKLKMNYGSLQILFLSDEIKRFGLLKLSDCQTKAVIKSNLKAQVKIIILNISEALDVHHLKGPDITIKACGCQISLNFYFLEIHT